MDPESSLPCLQQSSADLYPDPDESSPYTPSYFSKIRLNIILPTTSTSSCWTIYFWLSHQKPI
jgi:hypothetical protein